MVTVLLVDLLDIFSRKGGIQASIIAKESPAFSCIEATEEGLGISSLSSSMPRNKDCGLQQGDYRKVLHSLAAFSGGQFFVLVYMYFVCLPRPMRVILFFISRVCNILVAVDVLVFRRVSISLRVTEWCCFM